MSFNDRTAEQESLDYWLLVWHRELNRRNKDRIMRERIWPKVRRRYQQTVLNLRAQKMIRRHDVLIAVVSTPELVLYNIDAYHPRYVYLLSSPKMSQRSADLRAAIIADTEYDNSFSMDTVPLLQLGDDVGTTEIYTIIKEIRDHHPANETIVVDVTGGTSSMKAGTAMAGTWIGATISTIEVSYTTIEGIDGSTIEHGTQRPLIVEDPYHVFGDQDRRRALNKMASHDYQGAVEVLGPMVDRLEDTHGDRQLLLLADAYRAWEAFDLTTAHERLVQLQATTKLMPFIDKRWIADQLRILEASKDFNTLIEPQRTGERPTQAFYAERDRYHATLLLYLRSAEQSHAFVAMLLAAAERRSQQRRLDIAFLTLYRCLEFLAQQRLAGYHVLVDNWPAAVKRLRRLFADRGAVFDEEKYDHKPGLVKKWEIIAELGDELMRPGEIGELQRVTMPRNTTIFAHGFQTVVDEDYRSILDIIIRLVERWKQLTPLPGDTAEELARLYRHAQFIPVHLNPAQASGALARRLANTAAKHDDKTQPDAPADAQAVPANDQQMRVRIQQIRTGKNNFTGDLMPIGNWLKAQRLHGVLADVRIVDGTKPDGERLIGFVPSHLRIKQGQVVAVAQRESIGGYSVLILAAASDPSARKPAG